MRNSFEFNIINLIEPRNRRGQIVVEYLLLMVIAVTISLMLTKTFVSRGDEKGVLVKKMCEIHRFIAEDIPDNPATPKRNLKKGCD